MDKKIVNAIIGASSGIGGLIFGILIQSYRNLKNTPEAVLARLETEKTEAKTAKAEATTAKAENEAVLDELRRTKYEYQQEVRKDLEPKIRQELQDYISKADETYEKAKRERELSEAKLELARRLEKDVTKTGGFTIL